MKSLVSFFIHPLSQSTKYQHKLRLLLSIPALLPSSGKPQLKLQLQPQLAEHCLILDFIQLIGGTTNNT